MLPKAGTAQTIKAPPAFNDAIDVVEEANYKAR